MKATPRRETRLRVRYLSYGKIRLALWLIDYRMIDSYQNTLNYNMQIQTACTCATEASD